MNAFVLSGGGNLGAIEVGTLLALFEADIVPDMIVGTSVGALNGAFIAADPTIEGARRLEEIWRGIHGRDVFPGTFVTIAFNLVVHRTHAYSNSGLRRLIRDNLMVADLGRTSVPVHVVATDVVSGADRVFSSGPAEPALLASSAIPGIFPPIEIDGRTYIDGGVANNVPISHAVMLGALRIYVLNVGYPCGRSRPPDDALEMVLQSLSIAREQRLIVEIAHYKDKVEMIHIPPICPLDVSLTDFSQTGRLIDESYRHTRRFLEDPDAVPHGHVHRSPLGEDRAS